MGILGGNTDMTKPNQPKDVFIQYDESESEALLRWLFDNNQVISKPLLDTITVFIRANYERKLDFDL
jgi:hypothetical protein